MSENPENDRINRIVKGARKLTSKEKRVRVRKTAQQVLLYLGDTIAKRNLRYYTTSAGGLDGYPSVVHDNYEDRHLAGFVAEECGDSPEEAAQQTGWKSGYRNIVPVEKGDNEDCVTSLVGLGNNLVKFFTFELTSAQQALLYPKIRLFKVDYAMDPVTGELETPFAETDKREIVFDKAVTTTEKTILTERGGNLGSSGIQSFEWSLKGVNPAEVDSNIEASLTVYFNNIGVFQQRIEDLVDLADTSAEAASLGELWEETRDPYTRGLQAAVTADASMMASRVNKQAHFMDLITFAPPTTTTTSQLPCLEDYQPYFFEVLAEVGWEIPGDSAKGVFTAKQLEFIEKQTVKLYLTLSDHKFDFKEDGSATLTVNYRARHNFSDRSHDILYPADAHAKELASFNDRISELSSSPSESSQAEPTKAEKKELETQQDQREKLLQDNYKRIINQLLHNMYEAEIPNSLLLNDIIDPRDRPWALDWKAASLTYAELFMLLGDVGDAALTTEDALTKDELQDALASLVTSIRTQAKNVRVGRRIYHTAERISIANKTLDPDGNIIDDRQYRDTPGVDEKLASDISGDRTGTSNIQFLYLGDILETFFETAPITTSIAERKFAFITADTLYDDIYTFIEQTFGGETGKPPEIQNFDMSKFRCAQLNGSVSIPTKVINLANIPIELGGFLDFFTEKVISSNKQNYYLNSFIGDLFTSFLRPLLGHNAISGVPNAQPALINIDIPAVDIKQGKMWNVTFVEDTHGNAGFDSPRTPATAKTAYKTMIPTADVNSDEYVYIAPVDYYQKRGPSGPMGPVFGQNPDASKLNNTATVKVFGIARNSTNLLGEYAENMTQSIANFVVGLDRGLIKAVSFERVDQPYLREARVARDKSFGLGQLRELYHANLTLYGNNILKPGQLIYVEPNRLIFGRPTERKSVARTLGLGGYHLVVDVSNTIGLDGWETTVKALHVAMPLVTDKSGVSRYLHIEDPDLSTLEIP